MLREKKEPIIQQYIETFQTDIETISNTISKDFVKDSELTKDIIHDFLLDFFNRGMKFKTMFYECMMCKDTDIECPLCDHVYLNKEL